MLKVSLRIHVAHSIWEMDVAIFYGMKESQKQLTADSVESVASKALIFTYIVVHSTLCLTLTTNLFIQELRQGGSG